MPDGVELVVVIERVELAEPELIVTGVGLNVAVAPLGRPLALRLTLPVNPLVGETVIV